MTHPDFRRFDAIDLERKARQMQAAAMADGVRSVGRWLRGALGR